MVIQFGQLADRYGNNLGILTRLIFHIQYANRATFNHGAWYQWVRRWYQYVNRVTIQRQGLIHKAVVAGIEHRGGHKAVYPDGTGVFIHFVFDWIGIGRNFNNYVNFIRQIFASCYIA